MPLSKTVACPECRGDGERRVGDHLELCLECDGDGVISHARMAMWELRQGRHDTEQMAAVRPEKE